MLIMFLNIAGRSLAIFKNIKDTQIRSQHFIARIINYFLCISQYKILFILFACNWVVWGKELLEKDRPKLLQRNISLKGPSDNFRICIFCLYRPINLIFSSLLIKGFGGGAGIGPGWRIGIIFSDIIGFGGWDPGYYKGVIRVNYIFLLVGAGLKLFGQELPERRLLQKNKLICRLW